MVVVVLVVAMDKEDTKAHITAHGLDTHQTGAYPFVVVVTAAGILGGCADLAVQVVGYPNFGEASAHYAIVAHDLVRPDEGIGPDEIGVVGIGWMGAR